MKTTIGKFDAETGTVPVRFVHQGVTHSRPVNAVLDENGQYDKAATALRVGEVAIGVGHKIALGVIGNPVE